MEEALTHSLATSVVLHRIVFLLGWVKTAAKPLFVVVVECDTQLNRGTLGGWMDDFIVCRGCTCQQQQQGLTTNVEGFKLITMTEYKYATEI